jgi:pilus assembly protein Flp/PilA
MGPAEREECPTDRQATERRRDVRSFSQFVRNFLQREDGPTAVEYAVMLALIIVVCIAAITTLGQNANNTFGTVGNATDISGS